MNKIKTLILMLFITLIFIIPSSASVTNRTTNCGTDGFDVCITFSGLDWWLFEFDEWYGANAVLQAIHYRYPSPQAENYISSIHNYGLGHSSNWGTRIYNEVMAHRIIGDGDVHMSKYYLTRSCQDGGFCMNIEGKLPQNINATYTLNSVTPTSIHPGGYTIAKVTLTNTNTVEHTFLIVVSGVNEYGYPMSGTGVVTLVASQTIINMPIIVTVPYDNRYFVYGQYNLMSGVYPYDNQEYDPYKLIGSPSQSGIKVVTVN